MTVDLIEKLECGTSLAEKEHSYEVEECPTPKASSNQASIESLRSFLADNVLTNYDNYTTFTSPYQNELPLVYCDQTASNRPVKSIEKYLQNVCLPLYGNTHTNTSITGSQSTAFVAEARQIVAEETNAKVTGKASLDVVLFTGQGTTSAVELLIDCLGLRYAKQTPVVFIGPYEHHSNIIPWRESGCEIVMIPECPNERNVDINELERLLQLPVYQGRMKMGTFAAASNVTGKVSPVNDIAAILHRHQALAFFDYATGASYLPMDMNPPPSDTYSSRLVAKDAIFFSPHKMLGGVGTPGVLVVKKHLVSQTNAPSRSGGGTVFYVTNTHHRFLSNRIERYEGGTPNVTGIIRVGLTFLLKRKVEDAYARIASQTNNVPKTILEYDYVTYNRVTEYLTKNAPNIVLLGEKGQNLPIFSFLVRCGNRFLHYNYVCAVLNDVFGIQSRGGCQCAGPYSQRLLGLVKRSDDGREVPNERNQAVENALLQYKERAELLRPGYTRLSLPFKGLRTMEVEYVMKALEWVSKHGWALMCQYRCNHRTGEWRHSSRQGRPLGRTERRWLGHYDIMAASPCETLKEKVVDLDHLLAETLANADKLLLCAKTDKTSIAQALKMSDAYMILGGSVGNEELEKLRWYMYPKECAENLTSEDQAPQPTDVSILLLGALHPVNQIDTLNCSVDPAVEKKRKLPPAEPKKEIPLNSSDSLRWFQDGNHSGEATFAEIQAGIDDGELSDRCLIFLKDTGEWVLFKSLSDQTSGEVMPQLKSSDNIQPKKANRGTSLWGKGDVVDTIISCPVASTACGNSSVSCRIPAEPMHVDAPVLSPKPGKIRLVQPPPKLMRLCTQAIMQWEMIQDGDRLLLGLSGGKDSLSLLHILLDFRRKLPIKFEIEVCTIDPMTPSFDPSPLIPYVESLGLKYHYIRDDIVSRATSAGRAGKMVSSLCAYCARMKRGNLYACARRNNCNKLVLAQHLDDCAESFFMSVMHNGFLRTMKANYQINAGDISVIRPLVYCREGLTTDFAKKANLPVINENCPACFEEPKERARVKKLLSREEQLYPHFYDNIRRSLIPLMHDESTAILRCYTEEVVARSKSRNNRHCKVADTQNDKVLEPPLGLENVSDEDLIKELARRKAQKYRLSGAMKRVDDDCHGAEDLTGQVCTLNGGNGSIPCRELME